MSNLKVIGGALYQWDTGRKVGIAPDEGITITEVHFENPGASAALVVEPYMDEDKLVADIPNILLQQSQDIVVYAVTSTADGERTVCGRAFGVQARQKPEDYVYTEENILQHSGIIDGQVTRIKNDRVLSVRDYTFYKCAELTDVDLPAVTSIGQCAFAYCNNLKTVKFPLVTTIGSGAFSYDPNLMAADFPLVTSILGNCFGYCTNLTTIHAPLLAKTGYGNNFAYCENLTAVNFPLLESVEYRDFYGCKNLATVDLPSVTNIDSNYVFGECGALKSLILRTTEKVCVLRGTYAFCANPIQSGAGYIYVPSALVDDYKSATNWAVFADQIRAIEDYPDICGGAA